MSSYASGSIRVPGLSDSGTDFVSMIKKLKEIESKHVTQLGQWKQDWQTRLNAFKELRGELINLQSSLNALNSLDKFLAKATVSSSEKTVTAVADSGSVDTNYKVEVHQLASNATWTKALPLYDKSDVIAADTGYFEYSYKGKTRRVAVPKNTTAEGFIKLINNDSKNLGVRAQLIQGADGLTFQLRGMDTGKSSTLVIRGTGNLTGLDVNLEDGKYIEEANRVTLRDGFSGLDSVINSTGESKTFVYTVDGTRRVVEVPDQCTIEELKDTINQQMGYGLASVDWDSAKGEYVFSIGKANTTYSFEEQDGDASGKFAEMMGREFAADSEKINPGGPPYEFRFQVGSDDGSAPKTYSIEVDEDMTARDLVNAIQSRIGASGKAELVEGGTPGSYAISVEIEDKEHRVTVEDGTLESMSYVPPEDPGWDISQARNAMVRINNYPSDQDRWLEVSSNTLRSGEVMPGITFYLHSAGEAELSVSTDTATIKENIQTFVDAVNSFRTKLMELTEYDESKEVLDPEYAESQFEMQKGGILQGNYGVQTVASRLKNALAGSALGFSRRMLDTDGSVLSGDLFTTLSQIGITTNATKGEAAYGLLEINLVSGKGGSRSLDQALEEDPEAVARLFAVANEGETDSDNFHYHSHLSGITRPGTYSVSYAIGADGKIDETQAYINGQLAAVDHENNTITATGDNNAAKGLVINVSDLAPGKVVSNESISIKSGKIQEILGMLEGSEGILGSNGTLRNLERNYQGIIDNIDKKIQKEDARLQRWENTMVLKFARLEGVLANYSAMQQNLESQLAQLSGNNK